MASIKWIFKRANSEILWVRPNICLFYKTNLIKHWEIQLRARKDEPNKITNIKTKKCLITFNRLSKKILRLTLVKWEIASPYKESTVWSEISIAG